MTAPLRAVVVRPAPWNRGGRPDWYTDRIERDVNACIRWAGEQGMVLVGVADAAGAMAMHDAGEADVVVASHAHHIPPPDFVKIVADEMAPAPRRPRVIPPEERRGGQQRPRVIS